VYSSKSLVDLNLEQNSGSGDRWYRLKKGLVRVRAGSTDLVAWADLLGLLVQNDLPESLAFQFHVRLERVLLQLLVSD
jgi:hypothetical protein